VRVWHCVTPYFSKRIELYKFIYLDKYLFVAFHADAYFPLYCKVFLYFITWVEVIKIQISLQITKIIGKEKNFPGSYLATGRNPAGIGVWPGQLLLSPTFFFILHAAQPAQLGLAYLHPVRPTLGRASPSSGQECCRVGAGRAPSVAPSSCCLTSESPHELRDQASLQLSRIHPPWVKDLKPKIVDSRLEFEIESG
jgi:hypothetical protein